MTVERVRIGLLGTPDSPYVTALQRAASTRPSNALPLQLDLLRFNELFSRTGLGSGVGELKFSQLDALIVRSMPLGSLEQVIFRMDSLQVCEQLGVPVVNPPRCLEVAIDKWLTLHRLEAAGVPVPATVACQSRAVAMQAFEEFGQDVLVKPLFGGEGRGIIRLQDPDMAWRVLGTLQQIGQVLYVQKFCPHAGYDIRVLMIGERTFAIKRISTNGGWKTNLSQGSRAEAHELTDAEFAMARLAARSVGGSVLGIDLLPCCDGQLLVLEVNAVPGWRGVEQAWGVDIASLLLSHVADLAEQKIAARR